MHEAIIIADSSVGFTYIRRRTRPTYGEIRW